MHEPYKGVDWYRVLIGFVLPVVLFQIICAFTTAVQIIPPLNLVLVPLSFAIVVAFLPNLMRAVEKGRPLDTEGMICIGIFIAWGDYVGRGLLSVIYRLWPELRWVADTDVNSWLLFFAIYAAVMHLGAPAVDNGRIPSRRWARIGLIAGGGLFVSMWVVSLPSVMHVWTKEPAIQTHIHDHEDFTLPRAPKAEFPSIFAH